MADIPVYVVVPVYNGAGDLPFFLSTLKASVADREIYLVAVDNASTDKSVQIIADNYPSAYIIKNTDNKGFSGGCNQGMAYAISQGAEYVMLANQDLLFEKNWLGPLKNVLDLDKNIGAAQAAIMRYPDKDRYNAYGNALHYLGYGYARADGLTIKKWQEMSDKVPFFYCSGAAVLYSCVALQKVGMFDEWFFMYHEDTDLSWRLRLAGYELAIVDESKVYHHYEFSRSIQKFYYIERNRFIILLKNYQIATLILIFPMFLVMEGGHLVAGFFELLSGKKSLALKEKLKAYAFFLYPSHWRVIRQSRKASQLLRRVSDRQLLRFFSDVVLFQELNNPLLVYVANPITRAYWWVVKRLIIW